MSKNTAKARLASLEAADAEIAAYNRWTIATGIVEELNHKAQEIQDTISAETESMRAKGLKQSIIAESVGWLDVASETLDKAARNLEELRDLLWSDYEGARSNALALLC